ncbi:8264_t:CDS:2, partial [Cetraspora pellucida]
TTASNQEVQELREKLTILQASKAKGEAPIYFRYFDSEIISLSSESWEDFSQLYVRLKNVFGLKGPLLDYIFSIGDKLIDLSWSKSVFIDFIEKHRCSANNPIIISGKKKGSLPSPSKLGEPEEWYKRQKTNAVDAICLNHCPPTASSSIPVSLLCSIFGKFKDLCDELSESEDNLFAYDFCFKMAKFYKSESDRQTEANKMLSNYLKRPVQPIDEIKYRTDGTICYGQGPDAYRELNVEYKKYNCGSDACPYLENCGYFLAFCGEKENHLAYHVTNFPCFLIAIPGPYFSVSGAVFTDKAIVDPLTPIFPLIWQKYDETMMVSIAKTFRALRISLQLLDQYYANVDELIQDEPRTVHPVHPSFPEVIIDDKSYMVQINSNSQDSQVSTNLLWEVTLLNEQEPHITAYVKAVQKHRYSLDTHKLLAEAGYAPKVFTTSVIPGNWILVYMECLNNHSILNHIPSKLDDQKRSSLRKKIKEVVEYLHNLGYVHGDLREGNILVRQLEDNEFDVKLIDFEWSGKVGSACYSPFMNRKTIQWPDGAEDWKLVTKNHDLFMSGSNKFSVEERYSPIMAVNQTPIIESFIMEDFPESADETGQRRVLVNKGGRPKDPVWEDFNTGESDGKGHYDISHNNDYR